MQPLNWRNAVYNFLQPWQLHIRLWLFWLIEMHITLFNCRYTCRPKPNGGVARRRTKCENQVIAVFSSHFLQFSIHHFKRLMVQDRSNEWKWECEWRGRETDEEQTNFNCQLISYSDTKSLVKLPFWPFFNSHNNTIASFQFRSMILQWAKSLFDW